jgi:hypothetical protein
MEKVKKKIIRLVIAVFLTLAPIAVFNSVWHIIKMYLPLINAVAMILSGSFLIIMYFKGYSWATFACRFKNLFIEKEGLQEYMKKRFDPDPMYKSKSVLVVGIFLIIGALFFINHYRVVAVEQGNVRLIEDMSR